jgi:hypothetical protein
MVKLREVRLKIGVSPETEYGPTPETGFTVVYGFQVTVEQRVNNTALRRMMGTWLRMYKTMCGTYTFQHITVHPLGAEYSYFTVFNPYPTNVENMVSF